MSKGYDPFDTFFDPFDTFSALALILPVMRYTGSADKPVWQGGRSMKLKDCIFDGKGTFKMEDYPTTAKVSKSKKENL